MNERHAANTHGDFRDGCTTARDGESGGRRCRWTAAAPLGSYCPRAPPAALQWRAQRWLDENIVSEFVHRWLLAMARTITLMLLMMGHAALAAGASQRLPDTCAAALLTGDLAWCGLGAIPPLLPLRTRCHSHLHPFGNHIGQRVLTNPPHFLSTRGWGSRSYTILPPVVSSIGVSL